MSAVIVDPKSTSLTDHFQVTDEALAEMRERYTGLSPLTPEGYEETRLAIADCRERRVAVERTRKELKEDSLRWGRMVDAEAKRITLALESIEIPLKEAKDAVDAEKERIRQEKAAAIQRQLEEAAAKKRAAEEAKLRAEREAEEARIAEERRKVEEERARLEAERAAMEAERNRLAHEELARQSAARAAQEERDRIEREKIDAERRAVEAERLRLEKEEAVRQAVIKAEQEAKERAERERIAEQERIVAEEKLRQELAALKPDLEKVATFCEMLAAIEPPKVKSAKVRGQLAEAIAGIKNVAAKLLTETAVAK